MYVNIVNDLSTLLFKANLMDGCPVLDKINGNKTLNDT